MRLLLWVVLAGLNLTPALADVVVDPNAPWPDRLSPCVTQWYRATEAQQGTMTYRQFITKCVGGKTALPIKAKALCQNGNASSGTEPGGACALDGGVAHWLN